ncbi:hypothetical protein [Candidatus Neptunochlamydia vexilliferae]|uniref:Uncharacterized protein n=1 Tax=Candidatus Neptunichlamydia vexilliferae TaxID=1651774 RepID=A0ABS0B120_9BACT|nr:hypothetical protein [Candidatus Neptunochlamydia vexilliferae]MBF5060098.1 hypothetical protein [Candidatus Neptunochlamydia vexilliferae]
MSLILATLLAAQAPIYMAPTGATPVKKEAPKVIAALEQPAQHKGPSEVMIISPEGRAKDLQAAIEYLKQKNPTEKPSVKLTTGMEISNIIGLDVMPGGTLLIFKVSTLKGAKYKVVKIEEIDSLVY